MIQNANDIYKLIMSPVYVMNYKHVFDQMQDYTSYNFRNSVAPFECIQITIYDKHMEIYKSKNMNSEYYENIRTTNKRGQKTMQYFKELLSAKLWAAMTQNVNSL